ncbi:MAG: hypothetical protein KGY80_04530, partial [Candidatus Thorarchaeota archaeon]|nr:hypothetical protein [Candidatus Thorarchaeota archaeon]
MYPDNPAKVIAKAELVGLRALVDLLRDRVNKDTRRIHTRALSKLRGAMDEWRASKQKGNPNFVSVTKQEKYLRFDELDFIWQSTARYGNTENKRRRSEKDGPVGYLNKLLNIHGAILRDYAVCLYPMPTPEEIGQRGTVPIWGYEGTPKLGSVETAHGPTLPELDFIDMIRSHGRHLCAKAFISRVEPKEFSKYALLQVRKLSTFLDYVYTGGDAGHWGFKRPRNRAAKRRQQGSHADQILSELVSEMEALYDSRIQPPPKPSSTYTRRSQDPDVSFFENLIDELHDSESDDIATGEYHQIWIEFLEQLLTKEGGNDEEDKEKSKAKLTDADACKIQEEIANKARYEGLKCHERLSFGLPQPFNLESAILEGDKFTEEGDDFLVIAETPVMTENGKGRVDLIALQRRTISQPIHMEEVPAYVPVGVFETKTATGFDLEIKTDTPRTAKKRDELPVIPKFITRKRPLTKKEWQAAVDATPQSNARTQLEYYHSAVKKEYKKYLQADSPTELISGVFLVDTQGDIQEVREEIISIIRQLCTGKEITSIPRDCLRAIISPIECESRIVLVLERSALENLTTIEIKGTPLEEKQTYNPFDQSVSGQTASQDAYILYVDARSSSTSGKSAAWIARYWNGLRYLHRLASKKKEPRVIWLDLAGTLSNPKLAHTRLRMSEHDDDIQELFKSIVVKNLSHHMNRYLYGGEYPPDIRSIVAKERKLNRDTIVVVSGWNWVKESTPPRLAKA